jgi:hypothetical protein
MTKNILSPVKHGEPLDRLELDQIATILGAHTLQTHCGAPKFAAPPGRGLEPWQKLRTEEMLRAHLEGNITIKELANACSFGKSFREVLSEEFRHLGPSAVNPAANRASQAPAFGNQQDFSRDCIAIRLLRSSRLQSDLQPY